MKFFSMVSTVVIVTFVCRAIQVQTHFRTQSIVRHNNRPVNQSDRTKKPNAAAAAPDLTIVPADGSPLMLDWYKLANGEEDLVIINNSGIQHTINIAIADLGLIDRSGDKVSGLAIMPPTTVILPLTSTHVGLAWVGSGTPRPGMYYGYLTVTEDSAQAVYRQVKLNFEGLMPLASSLSFQLYRLIPFTSIWRHSVFSDCGCLGDLLLRYRTPDAQLRRDISVGEISREQGGETAIYWDGNVNTFNEQPPRLRLKIPDLPYAGKYVGKLDLKGTDAGNTSVIVHATDLFIWPTLCLMLGVFLAIQAKEYLSIRRPLLGLRLGEARLDQKFADAQGQFEQGSNGISSYSIKIDFDRQRTVIRGKIQDLQRGRLLVLDNTNPDYKWVTEQLGALQEVLDKWAEFGALVASLESSLTDIRRQPQGLAFLNEAVGLVIGKPIGCNELLSVQAKVQKFIDFLTVWKRLRDSVDETKQQLQDYRTRHPDSDQTLVTQADDDLRTALGKLWAVLGPDDLATMTAAAASLTSGRERLSQLLSVPEFRVLQEDVSIAALGQATTLPPRRLLPPERADEFARMLEGWDNALAVLAYVVAILTGLTTYYFGKDFGTVQDYLVLLIWAVGTKTVIDGFGGIMGRLLRS